MPISTDGISEMSSSYHNLGKQRECQLRLTGFRLHVNLTPATAEKICTCSDFIMSRLTLADCWHPNKIMARFVLSFMSTPPFKGEEEKARSLNKWGGKCTATWQHRQQIVFSNVLHVKRRRVKWTVLMAIRCCPTLPQLRSNAFDT